MDINYLIAIVAVILVVISFLIGVEAAFFSAGRLAIEVKKKQNKYSGKIWSDYFQHPAKFLATRLLVSTLLLVAGVYIATLLLQTVWDYWGIKNVYLQLLVALLVSALALFVLELIFRSVFHARPNAIVSSGFVTFLITLFFSLFSWLALRLVQVSEWMLKYIFNVKLGSKVKSFIRPDIDVFTMQLQRQNQDEVYEKNNEIFENILSLSETKVKACLIPRKEIVAVKDDISVEELSKAFSNTKLSKLVVYGDSIDEIKGYVHQLDLFKNPQTITQILHPIPIVPESMNATSLINKFSKDRKSIAWVIDEFGGTAGIVTMEDLLEEIFGEIYDEYDVLEEFIDKQISATEFLFSGRLNLSDLVNKYGLHFRKDEEAETLSGYIINQNGAIPKQRDRIIIDDYQFDIVTVSKTRIEVVRLKILL